MKTPRFFRALSCALLTVSLGLALQAQAAQEFYKWTDKNGVVHYSEHPPKAGDSELVRTTNLETGSDTAADTGDQAGDQAQQETAATEPPPKDPVRCENAQKNLETLRNNTRIRILDGDNYRYLNEDEIQSKTEANQKIVDQDC